MHLSSNVSDSTAVKMLYLRKKQHWEVFDTLILSNLLPLYTEITGILMLALKFDFKLEPCCHQ